jgi:LysM repeat protein
LKSRSQLIRLDLRTVLFLSEFVNELMKRFLCCLIITSSLFVSGQEGRKMTRKEYIDTYKDLALREMERTGIPASITLAQGLLESGDGNSRLARKANNHFGIKCHNDWKGKTIYHDDDAEGECFRKYESVEESYRDHSDFLTGRSRYAELFKNKPGDYKAWAKGLKQAGYATSPTYAEALIRIIEENELQVYDQVVLTGKGVKSKEKPAYESTEYAGGRKVYYTNRVKYVIAREGDSFFSLSDELNLFVWLLTKYNEMPDSVIFREGDRVYIQPKRNKAEVDKKTHIVKEGETLLGISQLYAVKKEKLALRNQLTPGDTLRIGQELLLREKKKGSGLMISKPKIEVKDQEPAEEYRIEYDLAE